MQRTDSLNASQQPVVFKKRAYRPWSPAAQSIDSTIDLTIEPAIDLAIALAIDPLPAPDEKRVSIGGFLNPKNVFSAGKNKSVQKTSHLVDALKNKERELLSLESDLKVAQALEYVETLELEREKEAENRKISESKTVVVMQRLHAAEQNMQALRRQIEVEQTSRVEFEKIHKILEMELKNALEEISNTELKLEQALQSKISLSLAFEEKLKCAHSDSYAQESAKRHSENLSRQYLAALDLTELEKQQLEKKLQILSQDLADREQSHKKKITELFETIQALEEQKFAIQTEEKARSHQQLITHSEKLEQQYQAALRKVEFDKVTLQESLDLVRKNAKENKIEHEREIEEFLKKNKNLEDQLVVAARDMDNVREQSLREIEDLQKQKAQTLEIEKARFARELEDAKNRITQAFQSEGAELEQKISQEISKTKTLESVAVCEKNLRKILQEKLNGAENAFLELTRKSNSWRISNAQSEAKTQAFLLQIADLEKNAQNALDSQALAEQKIEVLLSQKCQVEEEKGILAKELSQLREQGRLLEENIASEQAVIIELEASKNTETLEKAAAQERATSLMAQVQELEVEKAAVQERAKSLREQVQELENGLHITMQEKASIEKKMLSLESQKQQLEQALEIEKARFSQELEDTKNRIIQVFQSKGAELEQKISQEISKTEALESVVVCEKNLRKILQEKLNSAEDAFVNLTRESNALRVLNVDTEAKAQALLLEKRQIEEEKGIFAKELSQLREQSRLLEENIASEQAVIIELEASKNTETLEKTAAQERAKSLTKQVQGLEVEKTVAQERAEFLREQVQKLEIGLHITMQEKASVENQVLALESQKQKLEQEKIVSHEKVNQLSDRAEALENHLENERNLRKEAERLKELEVEARKLTHEKIYSAFEQINRTILRSGTEVSLISEPL